MHLGEAGWRGRGEGEAAAGEERGGRGGSGGGGGVGLQGRSGEAGSGGRRGGARGEAAGSSGGGEGEAAEGRLGDTGAAPVAAVASGCRRRGWFVELARAGIEGVLRKILGQKGQRGGGPTCKWRPENSMAHLLVGAPQKGKILWRIF